MLKNQSKINQKCSKIALGGCLGASWGLLGPSWPQGGPKRPKRTPKAIRWTPPGPPRWGHVGAILGLCWGHVGAMLAPRATKTPLHMHTKFWSNLKSVLTEFWSILEGFWEGFGSQLGFQEAPKINQNSDWSSIDFSINFWSIWDRFWSRLGLQVGRPRGPKSVKNNMFFLCFLQFWQTWKQAVTWLIFWMTWPSTWSPKPSKIGAKMLPKSIRNASKIVAVVVLFFICFGKDFWTIFDRLGFTSWGHVGAMLATKTAWKQHRKRRKKNLQKGRPSLGPSKQWIKRFTDPFGD